VRHRGVAVGGAASVGSVGAVGESPALVRQGSALASCFHPELMRDRRVHRLFAEMCA
jgi:glutamine amidotransferase PdxT